MRQVLPIAVAMLPINAAVYVFDGVITGAADFKFMAGTLWWRRSRRSRRVAPVPACGAGGAARLLHAAGRQPVPAALSPHPVPCSARGRLPQAPWWWAAGNRGRAAAGRRASRAGPAGGVVCHGAAYDQPPGHNAVALTSQRTARCRRRCERAVATGVPMLPWMAAAGAEGAVRGAPPDACLGLMCAWAPARAARCAAELAAQQQRLMDATAATALASSSSSSSSSMDAGDGLARRGGNGASRVGIPLLPDDLSELSNNAVEGRSRAWRGVSLGRATRPR